MQLTNKFIAFVDILGFSSAVERIDNGGSLSLEALAEATRLLGSDDDVKAIKAHGPSICPCARRVQHDVDFQLSQVSDCVVISTEVSPSGVITIIEHCWRTVFGLLRKGLMCRGHIGQGKIYHRDGILIGPGYQEAASREKTVAAFKRDADDRGTPFVELDSAVRDYVASCGDRCVVAMYERMVKEDEEVAAIFPFKRFGKLAGFSIEAQFHDFDQDRARASVEGARQRLLSLRYELRQHVDPANTSAVRKLEHYELALEEELRTFDGLDGMIEVLAQRVSGPLGTT